MDLAGASIGQLLIPVTDLERAIVFYRDTLGIRFLFAAPPQMSFFQAGTVRLLIGVPPAGEAAGKASAIYFQVSHIHETYRTLRVRGVAFGGEPHVVHRTPTTELWLADFEDPDGNPLVLMCEAPRAS